MVRVIFLAVTKSQSYERCVTSDICRPVVPNVIRRLGEFKFTVTCFHSTSSQPMSEFHSCSSINSEISGPKLIPAVVIVIILKNEGGKPTNKISSFNTGVFGFICVFHHQFCSNF